MTSDAPYLQFNYEGSPEQGRTSTLTAQADVTVCGSTLLVLEAERVLQQVPQKVHDDELLYHHLQAEGPVAALDEIGVAARNMFPRQTFAQKDEGAKPMHPFRSLTTRTLHDNGVIRL